MVVIPMKENIMERSRILMYTVIALVAVMIGLYYLHTETPSTWHWPINIVQLFTRH